MSIISKLRSNWFFGGASVREDPRDFGYYQLTKFEGDRPVLDGKPTRIRRGRGVYDLGMQLKDFFLGRLMSDQEFLRAKIRHDMDDEAPLTNPYQQVAGVYACVRARSVPIAMVPLKVFEWKTDPKTDEQELVEVDNDLSLVLFNPNPVTSRYNLVEGSVASLSLNGEFMWFLDRDQPTDFPRAIWPLPVTQVKPIKDRITGLPVLWEYDPGPTKPKQIYDLHQIVHGKRWSNTSYLRGLGDQKAASMASGQDWDAQRYNRTFLKNACDPGGTFELPMGVTLAPEDERKVLKAWEERHQGPAKQGRPGILTGGMKWNNNAIPHRDMRWLKQREWNLQDIRMVHGVGKIHLGMTDGVSVATAEVTERLFWTNEEIPEIRLIEDAIWQVTRFIENGRYEVLFDLRGVAALQKGIEEKTQAAKDLFSLGAPAQEVNRALGLGLEPWPGWDVSYLPLALMPAGSERPPPGEEAARTILRPVGRQKSLSPPPRRPTDPITKRAEARRRLLPDGVPGGPRVRIWPAPKNGTKKASMAEMARKLAAYLETARKSGVGVLGDGVLVPEMVHDILAEKDGMILCADPAYPFTPEEDRAYAEKFLQEVYKEDEEEFASKYSRWNQEHRVQTLRNFKRETDWEGDPTKAVTIPGELRQAIMALKPKAFKPDGFDLLLNLHDGISDRVLSLDEKYLDRILKQTDVNIDDVLPDPEKWGKKLGDATRAAYESALLTGAAARAGDLGTAPQITAIRVDLAAWLDTTCTKEMLDLSPKLNLALKRSLVEGILEGETVDQLATRIKRVHNKSGNRAATIARTEVGKAGEHGAYRESTESGLVEGHWWVPGGANIRESHAAMRGQFAALGTTFTTGKGNSLLHPHDPQGVASEVINCFPGDQTVEAAGIQKAFRAPYSGALVTLKTASGKVLTGTPNHPILTPKGFVPLGLLHKGDEVLACPFGEPLFPGKPNVHDEPVPLSEVFDSLAGIREVERIAGTPMDFYGDGGHGDVDVVGSFRELLDRLEAGGAEVLGHYNLHLPDLGESLGFTDGLPLEFEDGCLSAPAGDIRGTGEGLPFFDGGVPGPNLRGGTATPDLDASSFKAAPDHATTHAALPGDGLLGFSPLVFTDEVTDLRFREVDSVQVFTLQTDTGLYKTQGIIARNCKCILRPRLKD